MVIKIYTSHECGNTKIKRDQAYILRILYIKNIEVQEIDLSDPNREREKRFMQESLRLNERELKGLPPQIFNEDLPVGIFEGFEDAVEQDLLYSFLNMEIPPDEIEYLRKTAEEVNEYEEEKARRELSAVTVVLEEMQGELSHVREELDTVKQEVHKERHRADNLQKKLDRVLSVASLNETDIEGITAGGSSGEEEH